jgi:hypothetical protein
MKTLLSYSCDIKSDKDKEILEKDIIAFTNSFSNLLDVDNFEHCIIIQHFKIICEQYNVACTEMLSKIKENQIFMLYLSIKEDRTRLCENRKDAERERKQKILELCQNTTDEEFDNLWATLEYYKIDSQSDKDIFVGIDLVFQVLAEDSKRFLTIVKSYMLHNTPFNNYKNIILRLIKLLGYDDALELIEKAEFRGKKKWITNIYDNIPDDRIDNKIPSLFLDKLTNQKDETSLSLAIVCKINSQFPGFMVKYVETMNNLYEKHPCVICNFLHGLEQNNIDINEFVSCFEHHIDVLKNAYIIALRRSQIFDCYGQLLTEIIKKDIGYISIIVKNTLKYRHYHDEGPNLRVLWDQENYDELITITMETIKEESEFSFDFNFWGERILTYEKDEILRCERQKNG